MSINKSNAFDNISIKEMSEQLYNLPKEDGRIPINTYLNKIGIKLDVLSIYMVGVDIKNPNIILVDATMNNGQTCNILEYALDTIKPRDKGDEYLQPNEARVSSDAFGYLPSSEDIEGLCYWLCKQLKLEIPKEKFSCMRFTGLKPSRFKKYEEDFIQSMSKEDLVKKLIKDKILPNIDTNRCEIIGKGYKELSSQLMTSYRFIIKDKYSDELIFDYETKNGFRVIIVNQDKVSYKYDIESLCRCLDFKYLISDSAGKVKIFRISSYEKINLSPVEYLVQKYNLNVDL